MLLFEAFQPEAWAYQFGLSWPSATRLAFERRFVGQGRERRTLDESFDAAWDIMSGLPDEELSRIPRAVLDAHRAASEPGDASPAPGDEPVDPEDGTSASVGVPGVEAV